MLARPELLEAVGARYRRPPQLGSPSPGWVEVDFVAHGGTTVAGKFVQTLVLTDVATGWTE